MRSIKQIIFKNYANNLKTTIYYLLSKIIFDQKNEGFLSSCFTTDEEIFVVLNPSEKDREKQSFLNLSLLSHNLNGKLIFSDILIACCFWCFQMVILMLSNYTFDALLQSQSIQSVEIERPEKPEKLRFAPVIIV